MVLHGSISLRQQRGTKAEGGARNLDTVGVVCGEYEAQRYPVRYFVGVTLVTARKARVKALWS